MVTYYVGWDVGAWKCKSTKFSASSQDAIAVLDGEGNLIFAWMGNIYSEHKAEPQTGAQANYDSWAELLNNLYEDKTNIIFKDENEFKGKDKFNIVDKFTIAIDAVLGVPKAMRFLWNLGYKPSLSFKEIAGGDPFVFRTTEQLLESKPLSVVRDMIGSQSSKALYTLKSMGLSWNKASLHWTGKNVSAFETYPAAASSRLNFNALDFFSEQKFPEGKKLCMGKYDGFEEYIKVISGNGGKAPDIDAILKNKEKCKELKNRYSDFIDAIVCAQVAALSPDKLQEPSNTERSDATEEGWIWLPKGCEKKV